ncbi:ABC transporter permease [Nocardia uniformis]|uniref:ABC transporter permease n=1 Tax=Nocardia uniformis TaxID=53432 RepID=A0A849BUA2_9NOCA|nr:ABC transporter permease [Nocardia uniformis]NNH68436.1 ABC transporter permease [Nocardia uniformis]
MSIESPQRRARFRHAAGTGTLLRFALRRERFTLPGWVLGAVTLLVLQSVSSQRFYDTPAKLAQLRNTMAGNAAAVAMGGPTRLLDTIGGEILFEIFGYLAIVVALMNMFLVGRLTRTDEESGRMELIRSAPVGRRAPVIAALLLAGLANLTVALAIIAAAIATGLPVHGSLLLGVAVAGVGATFAALTAVAAQVFENPRSVYGSVALLLAVAYVLRAIGDIGDGTLSWASPLGWGQRTYPYVAERWWPLLLFAVASVGLTAVAFALLGRRDLGAGLLAYATGRPTASWTLRSSLSLAWRLQRGTLLGWCVGVFGLGAAYGSFANSIEEYLADNPEFATYLPGGAADAVNSYLALTLSMLALLASAYAIGSVLRARAEEVAGRLEPILAVPVSRHAWFGGHLSVALIGSAIVLAAGGFGEGLTHGLAISDAGELSRLTLAALVYLPAVWIVAALAAVAVGWLPRAAITLAWSVFAYCVLAVLFTTSFDLPDWFDDAAPFAHTPQAPLEAATALPLLVLVGVGAAGIALALTGLRRRDIGI